MFELFTSNETRKAAEKIVADVKAGKEVPGFGIKIVDPNNAFDLSGIASTKTAKTVSINAVSNEAANSTPINPVGFDVNIAPDGSIISAEQSAPVAVNFPVVDTNTIPVNLMQQTAPAHNNTCNCGAHGTQPNVIQNPIFARMANGVNFNVPCVTIPSFTPEAIADINNEVKVSMAPYINTNNISVVAATNGLLKLLVMDDNGNILEDRSITIDLAGVIYGPTPKWFPVYNLGKNQTFESVPVFGMNDDEKIGKYLAGKGLNDTTELYSNDIRHLNSIVDLASISSAFMPATRDTIIARFTKAVEKGVFAEARNIAPGSRFRFASYRNANEYTLTNINVAPALGIAPSNVKPINIVFDKSSAKVVELKS